MVNVEVGSAGTGTCSLGNMSDVYPPCLLRAWRRRMGERHHQRKEYSVGDNLSVTCCHKYTYIRETLANLEYMAAANIVISNRQISVGLKMQKSWKLFMGIHRNLWEQGT